MTAPQSDEPTTHCSGAADDDVAGLGCSSVNTCLREYLQRQRLSSSSASCVASAVFLDALERYPLPVVSAATVCDVADSALQQSLHRRSLDSPLQRPLYASSESVISDSASPIPTHASTDLPHRHRCVNINERTHSRTASALAATINQFWDLSASAASAPQQSTPPWVAFSPFRVCANPSFHTTLQSLAGHHEGTRNDRELRQHVTSPPRQCRREMVQSSCPLLPGKGVLSSQFQARDGGHGNFSSVSALTPSPTGIGSISFDALLGAPWTVMDALCHGFGVSSSPSTHHRKRARPVTAGSPSLTHVASTLSVHDDFCCSPIRNHSEVIATDRRLQTLTRGAAQNALPTHQRLGSIASPVSWSSPQAPDDSPDALHSRVAENDDLLGLLLGAEHSAPHPSMLSDERPGGEALCAEAVEVVGAMLGSERAGATTALAERSIDAAVYCHEVACEAPDSVALVNPDRLSARCVQVIQSGGASAVPTVSATAVSPRLVQVASVSRETNVARVADERKREEVFASSVKTLRDTCARLGLLSTGSKATLQQRLRLYYTSDTAKQCSSTNTPLTSRALNTTHPGGRTDVLSSTGSPPRTVFRYRSPSHPSGSVPSVSAGSWVAAHPQCTPASEAIREPATQMETVAVCKEVSVSGSANAVALCQRDRLVPSPTQFLHDLAACKMQTPTKALQTVCNTHLSAFLRATHSQEEELKGEISRVRWQWLVDFRERASAQRGGGGGGGRRQHENMLEIFRKQHVSCRSAMLPAGDFMLCVELSTDEADAMRSIGLAATTEIGARVSSDPTTPEGTTPVLSHACSLVVERKTAADLDASVKSARYVEQRRLLAASPFRLVIWLIEGAVVGSGCDSGFFRGGQRHRRGGGGEASMQPDVRSVSPTASSPAESVRQRVDSACASLGLHGKSWIVVRTRSTTESVQFLKLLATHVARQLASYRLHLRCAGMGVGGIPAVHHSTAASEEAAQHSRAQQVGCNVEGNTHVGCGVPCREASRTCLSAAVALLYLIPTNACLQSVAALQRHLRAKTAFPRMLMCVRGCSAALASLLSCKYGTLLQFWRELRQRGQEACDADPDIQRLSTAQKKVYVLLTEFLLAKDYL